MQMEGKKIAGYSDKISVAPGESIDFKVSTFKPGRYSARLVRLIHGDMNPEGPGYKEEAVACDFEGEHAGRTQLVHAGSHAIVPGSRRFAGLTDFTLQAIVWPTLPGDGEQALVALWNAGSESGVWLGLDADGALSVTLSNGRQCSTVSTGKPLLSRHWYSVAAVYDRRASTVTLHQLPHKHYARIDDSSTITETVDVAPHITEHTPCVFGGLPTAGESPIGRLYNGRIDRPRLLSAAADLSGIRWREAPKLTGDMRTDVVAAWDFSEGISTDRIHDQGPGQHHGRTVNTPVRAVRGANWTGEEMNWQHAPEQYGAMHFHEDSLYDAGWDTSFSLTVPDGMRSGLYAAHVTYEDDEDFMPFVIRAEPGATRNRMVYLVPTADYMAYANEHMPTDAPLAQLLTDQVSILGRNDRFVHENRHFGASCYDTYKDGEGVCYTSRLRPVLNMRPKYRMWLGGAGSKLWQFNADTHIIDWIEESGFGCDYLSDEDVHEFGEQALEPYSVIITSTHSEYWSKQMRDAVDAFKKRGGRLISMGGNVWYWRVAYHSTLPGLMEVRRAEGGTRAWAANPGEYYHSFTGEYGGLWRRQGLAPQEICGTGFVAQGFDISSYYVRQPDSFDERAAFIFEGIGESEKLGDFGLIGGGAAGLEVDHVDPLLGTPPNTLVLASSEGHTNRYQLVAEEILINFPGTGGEDCPLVKGDIVFFETAEGGAVFSTSSIAFGGSLSHNNYDNNISRMMDNVVRRFLNPEPFA